jgi:hypothetical protein
MKLAYNEMVQLWGSLFESGLFYFRSQDKWLKKESNGIFKWLRDLLLFDVSSTDCHWRNRKAN